MACTTCSYATYNLNLIDIDALKIEFLIEIEVDIEKY